MTDTTAHPLPLRELSRPQRRILGVLLEKAFTTPDVYPLTLKAATAGCNQKSNRDPVVEYDEDRVERVLDELRELGLVAIVHTESGRSARYRHYMRHKLTLSEPQLAILTELLLRGRQSLGDLRVRASRMVPIDSLEQLRSELQGLIDHNFIQSDGSLDRRGVEVDHNLYPSTENHTRMTPRVDSDDAPSARNDSVSSTPRRMDATSISPLIEEIQSLRTQNQELAEQVQSLTTRVESLEQKLTELAAALGS